MSQRWLDLSYTSNRFKKTYMKGFMDISGGNLTLRKGSNFIGNCDASFSQNLNIITNKGYNILPPILTDISSYVLKYWKDISGDFTVIKGDLSLNATNFDIRKGKINVKVSSTYFTESINNLNYYSNLLCYYYDVSLDTYRNDIINFDNNNFITTKSTSENELNLLPNFAPTTSDFLFKGLLDVSGHDSSGNIFINGNLNIFSNICINNDLKYNGEIYFSKPNSLTLGNVYDLPTNSVGGYSFQSKRTDIVKYDSDGFETSLQDLSNSYTLDISSSFTDVYIDAFMYLNNPDSNHIINTPTTIENLNIRNANVNVYNFIYTKLFYTSPFRHLFNSYISTPILNQTVKVLGVVRTGIYDGFFVNVHEPIQPEPIIVKDVYGISREYITDGLNGFDNENFALYTADIKTGSDSKLHYVKTNVDVLVPGRMFVLNNTSNKLPNMICDDLSLGGNLFIKKDIFLNKNILFLNDLSINIGKKLLVKGDATSNSGNFTYDGVNDLFIGGNSNIYNNTVINGNISVMSDSIINNRCFVASDVSINNSNIVINNDISLRNSSLIINDDCSLNNKLSVHYDLSINGATDFKYSPKIFGNIYPLGDLSANSYLELFPDITYFCNNIFVKNNLYLSKKVIIQKDATINKRLIVLNNFIITGNVSMLNSNLIINYPIIIPSDTYFGNYLKTQKDFSISSGNWYLIGNNIINGQSLLVRQYLQTSNNLYVSNAISCNASIKILNNTTISGNISISKDASIYSNLYLPNNIAINGRCIISGNVFINKRISIMNDVTTNAKINVKNDVLFKKRLNINGQTSINGKLSVIRDVLCNGNIELLKNIILKQQFNGRNVKLTGKMGIVRDMRIDSSMFVNSTATFKKNCYFLYNNNDSKLNFKGNFYIAKDSSFNNVFVKSDFIGAKTITINSLKPVVLDGVAINLLGDGNNILSFPNTINGERILLSRNNINPNQYFGIGYFNNSIQYHTDVSSSMIKFGVKQSDGTTTNSLNIVNNCVGIGKTNPTNTFDISCGMFIKNNITFNDDVSFVSVNTDGNIVTIPSFDLSSNALYINSVNNKNYQNGFYTTSSSSNSNDSDSYYAFIYKNPQIKGWISQNGVYNSYFGYYEDNTFHSLNANISNTSYCLNNALITNKTTNPFENLSTNFGGGQYFYSINNYSVMVFTNIGTTQITFPYDTSLGYICVGGGGAGGSIDGQYDGSGGYGGAVNYASYTNSNIRFNANVAYNIQVGYGGNWNHDNLFLDGGISSIQYNNGSIVSSGGGSGNNSASIPQTGYGYINDTGPIDLSSGIGGYGGDNYNGGFGGNGGQGVSIDNTSMLEIINNPIVFSSGGGGAGMTEGTGTNGAGNGDSTNLNGSNAIYYGCGGGGGSYATGYNGFQGIVILWFPTPATDISLNNIIVTTPGEWLQIDLPSTFMLSYYNVSANISSDYQNDFMQQYLLLGQKSTSWVLLDSSFNQTYQSSIVGYPQFNNEYRYSKFRLIIHNILSRTGSNYSSNIQIKKLSFSGVPLAHKINPQYLLVNKSLHLPDSFVSKFNIVCDSNMNYDINSSNLYYTNMNAFKAIWGNIDISGVTDISVEPYSIQNIVLPSDYMNTGSVVVGIMKVYNNSNNINIQANGYFDQIQKTININVFGDNAGIFSCVVGFYMLGI